MKLYISHGASGDWFIVEPRDDPEQAVERLTRAGRKVYELHVMPWTSADKRRRSASRRYGRDAHEGT